MYYSCSNIQRLHEANLLLLPRQFKGMMPNIETLHIHKRLVPANYWNVAMRLIIQINY
jgi:hypothetical protein